MHISKSRNPEIKKYKTEIKPKYFSAKNLKNACLNFIPLDLTVMVVSWANKNLFK
jgi:hypothetical protein